LMHDLCLDEGLVQPLYDSYCLSNVRGTVMSLFGRSEKRLPDDVFDGVSLEGIEKVVLFVFDGFGMREWRRHTDGFVGALSSRGRVKEITSTFPSTTSTALTTISTGLTPQQHGLIEWYLYVKELDEIILTLPFSPLGSKGYDVLLKRTSPRILFSGTPISMELKREGIGTYSFLNRQIARTGYSRLVHAGSTVVPYASSSDLTVALRRHLESSNGPSFFYVYWSFIDTIEHSYGPATDESDLEAHSISHALKVGLLDRLSGQAASRTLFLATADHGQIFSPSEEALLLNRYRKLVNSFAVSRRGRPVLPWGSPRDVYIMVEPEMLEETLAYLRERIGGVADVIRAESAVRAGLFGRGRPSRRFADRVGNIMLLPRGTGSVWYRHPGVEPPHLKGQHGGLHPDEMRIPFAAARASSLL
jgi:predicted AlkP superfamily pyrophosphatase or phosphodiesterase